MGIPLDITLFIMSLANIILHTIGLYLLFNLYESSQNKVQQHFLIQLSAAELSINVFPAIVILFRSLLNSPFDNADKMVEYMEIVQFCGAALVYYMVMIYITLDRLFDILLNIKYPVYWSEYKTKYLMITTWIIGAIIAIAVCVARKIYQWDWIPFFFKYIYVSMNLFFTLASFLSYGFIFTKYKQTRVTPTASVGCKNKIRKQSTFYVFRTSRFYTSVLLIGTFFIFVVAPDFVFLFAVVLNKSISNQTATVLQTTCLISYSVSTLIDGWIYIFLQPRVRRELLKRLKHVSVRNASITTVSTGVASISRN